MTRRYTYATTLSWGGDTPTAELEVEVSYEVIWGQPARTYGQPERCHDGWPSEVSDIKVESVEGRESGWDMYQSDARIADMIIAKLETSDDLLADMVREAAEKEAGDLAYAEEHQAEDLRQGSDG